MEPQQRTTKDLKSFLYAASKAIGVTQAALNEINDIACTVLPKGNDLPHSARDLAQLLAQQKELLPNRFRIWLRYYYRPQKRMTEQVGRNQNEIASIYYDHFIRGGNGDMNLVYANNKEIHSRLEELIGDARSNIDQLMYVYDTVAELARRKGSHESYINEREFNGSARQFALFDDQYA